MSQHAPELQPASELVADERGLTRRQVAIGAAWAAPVVAMAIAAPAAAASAASAAATSGASSAVSTVPAVVPAGAYAGTIVTSAFTNGYLLITNVIGTWQTGALKLVITNPGGITSGRSIVDANGTVVPTGSGAVGTQYIAGGIVWSIQSSSAGILTLTAPSQSISTPGDKTYFAPSFTVRATYNGPWDEDEQEWPVYTAAYTVSAANVEGGGGAQGSFPSDPYAPPA